MLIFVCYSVSVFFLLSIYPVCWHRYSLSIVAEVFVVQIQSIMLLVSQINASFHFFRCFWLHYDDYKPMSQFFLRMISQWIHQHYHEIKIKHQVLLHFLWNLSSLSQLWVSSFAEFHFSFFCEPLCFLFPPNE